MIPHFETPYSKRVEELIQELKSNAQKGLLDQEAISRLSQFGKNRLKEKRKISPFFIFLKQFKDFMMVILMVVAAISFMIHDEKDGIVILVVVFLNAIISFLQEYKAEKTLSALKKVAGPEAKVIRDGIEKKIRAELLVPGDVIVVEAGDRVPADCRLMEIAGLTVQEALLTGESEPAEKGAQVILSGRVPVSDRRNMIFAGTVVTSGRGRALVTATGMATEMGKIADLIQTVKDKPTPLQIKLAQVGRYLVLLALFSCVLIGILGVIRGVSPYIMFLTAVSLGVAVIPEGLPAVVTIALSIGVQRMARRNAIVKRLPAVETLGSVTIICSDKTGTITEGVMRADQLWTLEREIEFTAGNEIVEGRLIQKGRVVKEPKEDSKWAFLIMGLANNAMLQKTEMGWEGLGDPTEVALIAASAKAGFWKEELEKNYTRLTELPFEAERKMMSTIYETPDERIVVLTKGAPEQVLHSCGGFLQGNEVLKLDEATRNKILKQNATMTQKGLRVIALAYRTISEVALDVEPEDVERELVFVGLTGIFDPPRREVPEAIRTCADAKIKTTMITGDHIGTAVHVAKRVGMMREEGESASGADLDRFTEQEWQEKVPRLKVFARISPEQKFRIVKTLRASGEIVAMTGDGINDAPAVKNANVGVAMGKSGTDVTREASDIVLTDDNFATIVAAVEEGRTIFSNIVKFIAYLFSCNAAEILIMMASVVVGFPLPLTPIQILWLNLVTDTPPALALGVEPPVKGVMKRPPRNPKRGIFTRNLIVDISYQGVAISAATLLVFGYFLFRTRGGDLNHARTAAFVTLAMAQLFHAFNCQNHRVSLFRTGLFTNKWMVIAVLSSVVMLLGGMYLPFLKDIFGQEPLDFSEWGICLSAALIPVAAVEIVKVTFKRRREEPWVF